MNHRTPEPARRDDLEAVAALVRGAGLPTEGLEDAFPGGYAVVRAGAEVVATAGLEEHGGVGLLRSVAVHESQRGRGLGRLLVEDRLAAARQRGLAAVYLLTTTAAEYFRGLGFADVDRAAAPLELRGSPEFKTVCPASAACLAQVWSTTQGDHPMKQEEQDNVRAAVREQYGQVARQGASGCCSSSSCCGGSADASLKLGYSAEDLAAVPEGADLGLGCGNPQAIAALKPGETVLDLGAGGGFDCFLAAKQVGPTGRVIGVDMTPDMVSKARANARKVEAINVEFRLGEIEHLPVADDAVDVILSNCVINLSPDKAAVFAEAFRVLKPGGRLAISDVVMTQPVPDALANDMKALTACVSGAARADALQALLEAVGFESVRIDINEASREFIREWLPGSGVENYVASATIEAVKPGACCCGPACCGG